MDILRQSSSTRENLSLLSVLEALDKGEKITQRELAQATGLNLKKVNYCLHKLLEKGHIKFNRARKNPDKRAYLYILTPDGLKAKSRLTYHFLKFTMDFYSKMEDKLRRCLMEMVEADVKRVLLYGAGDVTRILLDLADGKGIEVVGVVDDEYDGQDFQGVPLFKNEQLQDVMWDGILITTLEDLEKAEERLLDAGVALEAIWKLS